MIRHCVFIRFKPSFTRAERKTIFAEISALKGRLPGLLAVHTGTNVSPETGMDKGFAEGFMVDFAGVAASETYQNDPAHKATGAKIVAAAEGGLAGILVFDLVVAG